MDDGMSGPSTAGPSSSTQVPKKRKARSVSNSSTALPYLALRSSGSEISWSYIARTGFPLLATSSYLVEATSQEVKALLVQYTEKWIDSVDTTVSLGPPLSPFTLFKAVYAQRGWHLIQLYWSEHRGTREGIYHLFIRILTDHLRKFLPFFEVTDTQGIKFDADRASKAALEDVIGACGVLFALRLLQTTTCLTLSDTDFEQPSGRIPIEADLYHVLLALPLIIRANPGMTVWDIGADIRPIDEVIFVIKEMMGKNTLQDSVAQSNGACANESGSDDDDEEDSSKPMSRHGNIFDILAPSSYDARPALINNCHTSKAEIDRSKRSWGELNVTSKGEARSSASNGMSRADLMRNLLRQQLQLPLKSHSDDAESQSSSLSMTSFKFERRGHSKAKPSMAPAPDGDSDRILQACLDQVTEQKDLYAASKKQCFGGIEFESLLFSGTNSNRIVEETNHASTGNSSSDPSNVFAVARSEVFQALQTSMTNQRHNI